jgi:glutathione S-transferase
MTSEARGTYYRWMFFAAGPIEAAVANGALGVEVPADKRGTVGYGCFEDVLAMMEYAIRDREFILGDTFSAADVYFGSELGFGLKFGAIAESKLFLDYVGRVLSRPAALRASSIDDGLIAAAQTKKGA